MTVSKYWGDEKLADAIYAVYLKKVRYVPPSEYEGLPHYRSIDPDNHHLADDLIDGSDHLQWETIRERVIKAGTLDKIVENPPKHYPLHPHLLAGDVPRRLFSTRRQFPLLNRLIDFSRSRNLYDLKYKARKVKERYKKVAVEGGLASQIPSISRYCYTTGFDPNDYEYAQQRAQMFHVGKENVVQIAEQLSFWDAVLFRELRPYQCTGAIWGKRHKKSTESVYSVRATIDQFNAVSQRVMTSIVFPDCSKDFRAKIIEKWIEVARELRALKNFSSLKAVLGSLQAEPVHRLKSIWALVSKVSMSQFKDLSAIFETDENGDEQKARTILDAEGTAKSSPLKRPQLIQNCRRTKSDVNLAESQGTVPFLGTFLTDLTMLDQAHYDLTPEGLLNFEKRRKEFEVLAKIRLFQSAARAYTIPMDQAFCVWFYYLPSLNENECFNKSLDVEPSSVSTPDIKRRQPKISNGFYAPTIPITKIQSLTKMFTNIGTSEDQSPSPLAAAGQHSNDSGIHTEESWTTSSGAGTPNQGEAMFSTALLSRAKGIMSGAGSQRDRSSTAPSTPAGTLSLRGVPNYSGSEFNPQLHFSPSRTISRDNSPCCANGERASSSSAAQPDHFTDGLYSTTQHSRQPSKDHFRSENGKSNPFANSCRSATHKAQCLLM
uniref:Ras-GEF domain-containing protein n=1 Tax=Ditylenchus dipsaci TaxID=166011 RepID=A0A915EJ94_9BILA